MRGERYRKWKKGIGIDEDDREGQEERVSWEMGKMGKERGEVGEKR